MTCDSDRYAVSPLARFGVLAIAVLPIGICLAGCGFDDPCSQHNAEETTVVLSFDDGPFAADVPLSEVSQNSTELLDPLGTILNTLDRHGARSVFFIAGPATDEIGDLLGDVFAEGLLTTSVAGHVLAYHAFDHDAAIWATGFRPAILTELYMLADLNRLERYVDGVLAPVGRMRDELFTPVFRQPFGGAVFSRPEGERVAAARGWVYHGYDIDSADWTVNVNADAAFVGGLPSEGDETHAEFVTRRLRDGAARNAGRPVVDVLFHVNQFTAERLETWIEVLDTSFQESTGRPVSFGVPDCYLQFDDPAVDLTILGDLLSRN